MRAVIREIAEPRSADRSGRVHAASIDVRFSTLPPPGELWLRVEIDGETCEI